MFKKKRLASKHIGNHDGKVGGVMLLKFAFSNFSCFPNEVVLDFHAKSKIANNNRVSAFDINGINALKKCAIFGGNATGKSYAVKALSYFLTVMHTGFVEYGATDDEFLKLSIPHALMLCKRRKPSCFKLDFLVDGTVYSYGLDVLRDKILSESLYVFNPDGQAMPIFDNKYYDYCTNEKNQVVFNRNVKLNVCPFGDERSCEVLRFTNDQFSGHHDVSFLHVLKLNNWSVGVKIAKYVFSTTSLPEQDENYYDFGFDRKRMESFFKAGLTEKDLLKHLHDFDNTIVDVKFVEKVEYDIVVGHEVLLNRNMNDKDGQFGIKFKWESKGTRKYIHLLLDALVILKNGGALLVDEFDASLHPNTQMHFLSLFEKEGSDSGAQLIINSQNTTLLRCPYFRADELYITDMSLRGEASLHRLVNFYEESEYESLMIVNFEDEYNSGVYVKLPFYGQHDKNTCVVCKELVQHFAN